MPRKYGKITEKEGVIMTNITLNFQKTAGKIKPMHAVNNGPVGSKIRMGNNTYAYFREAGIPYARNHDASFYEGYGGEYTVDVHRIFRDFDADPTNPASYDFECTDQCVANTFSVGTEVYYRLGSRIEHGKKVGTFPPKDYQKWAVICEHIIRHYNEGWANGFTYGITYWEIWNEPDCRNPDGSNPCWQGSDEEFIDFFCVALKHLKGCFPHLKIGGPAFTHVSPCPESQNGHFVRNLFAALKEKQLPLDFFSFHGYASDPGKLLDNAVQGRKICDEFGYFDTKLHLNEWNYIRGWLGENWIYSLRSEKGLKGSSFVAAVMALGQASVLDMLMYYDARPCGMNGMFNTDFLTPLKGYYPFKMFGELYRMGGFVRPEYTASPIYCTAACGEEGAGIMITNYSEDDTAPAEPVEIELCGVEERSATLYLLDETHDMEQVGTLTLGNKLTLTLPLFSTYFIKIH